MFDLARIGPTTLRSGCTQETVNSIKERVNDLYHQLDLARGNANVPGADARHIAAAVTHLETACMFAVKACYQLTDS